MLQVLLVASSMSAALSDPLGPGRRAQLLAYLRHVNGWVAETNVGANNLTCQSAGPNCSVGSYIFINGNLARGLMAGHSSLHNQTQLDIGLQWCDKFVSAAYNTTASDGTVVKYWDSGYGAVFFGDTGTALQAVATGYYRAPEGSGGRELSRSRRAAYLEAMLGYYNYVTKGCVEPPAIPRFAYGTRCPPPGQGWLIKSGFGAGAIGDGFCPPKHTGRICFSPYSCATGTSAAGAFGALASLLAQIHHQVAKEVAHATSAAGEFIAGEVDSNGLLTNWNYDGTNATVDLNGSGWIPQHWIGYPFGEGLVQAALSITMNLSSTTQQHWALKTAPLVAYLTRSQHTSGYWGLNTTADTPDLRRGVRVVTFLQWHYSIQPNREVAVAIAKFVDFLLSDPKWLGVAGNGGPETLKDVGPGLVTGFVSLAVADLLQFGSSFVPRNPVNISGNVDSSTSNQEVTPQARHMHSTTYYVNSVHGNDAGSGNSPSSAWRTLHKARMAVLQPGDRMLFARGSVWRGQIRVQTGNISHRTTYGAYGDPSLPKPRFLGSLSASAQSDWEREEPGSDVWVMQSVGKKYAAIMDRDMKSFEDFDLRDIGNLIFVGRSHMSSTGEDRGEHRLQQRASVGWRVWARDELLKQDQWYYAASVNSHLRGRNETKLYFYSPAGNPALVHSGGIECAWMNFEQADLVSVNGVSYVTIESLQVWGSGSSAIGGGNMSHFELKDCDISYAGGACIEPGPRFKRNPLECTRYGNGVDIWEVASNVEIHSNRLWECYDTGFTNQGTSGNYTEYNISYHHNIIAHAECEPKYRQDCFELWDQNHPGSRNLSSMSSIHIEQNVCVDSGGGWSHQQRPDPSGRHICMFQNTAEVSNISIVNNIFYQQVPYQAGWWMEDDWGYGDATHTGWGTSIREDANVWFQTTSTLGMLIVLGGSPQPDVPPGESFSAANFSTYRTRTGNGAHSLLVDPLLRGLLNGSNGSFHRPIVHLSNHTDMRPIRGSPVIGRGQPTIWTTDFDGHSIAQHSTRPDIGAYECES